jgi:tetratricopeptide (TPR) repeat protein
MNNPQVNRDALRRAQRDLGAKLAAARVAAALTQEQLAERMTGYGRSSVANVEVGLQTGHRQFWELADRQLGAEGRLLRNYEDLQELRRQVKSASLAAHDGPSTRMDVTDIGTELDAHLQYVIRHPERTSLVAVAMLRERLFAIETEYHGTASASLLGTAGDLHGKIAFLRPHVRTGRVLRELVSAEAAAALLMGQLVWDASQRRDGAGAIHHLRRAAGLAQEACDGLIEAKVLLRQSFVAIYGNREPVRGATMANQAAAVAARVSPALLGLARLHEAEAAAMLGHGPLCDEALALGEEQIRNAGFTDPGADLVSANHVARLAGSCYLSLGRYRQAEEALASLQTSPGIGSKSMAIVLGNLALAQLSQRRLDDAVGTVHQAIDLLEQTRGGGGLNVVFRAVRAMKPWRDTTTVADLQDRMYLLMGT